MRALFIIVLIFNCFLCEAQVNLVRNPSFEQYSVCPDDWDELKYSNDWMSLDSAWSPPDWSHLPWGVPDLCHICAGSNPFVGIPYNLAFNHFARTGGGMVQLQTFFDEADVTFPQARDYMQGHLSHTLISGLSYCVTFFVLLEPTTYFAHNNIGAYFDDGTIDTTLNPGKVQVHCTPQVIGTSIISDTVNWIKIQGTFVAEGNERLINIGNFTDKAHTSYIVVKDTVGLGGYLGSLYLVDDVSVIKSDAVADAGPNRVIPVGSPDSVWIGDSSGYLPTCWYVNGVMIDSNTAGFKVHPDTTTRYVMSLDVCGHITYDTVIVWRGVNTVGTASTGAVNIYPSPAVDALTVEHAAGSTLELYDVVGRLALSSRIMTDRETLSIFHLLPGVYTALIRMQSGKRVFMKVVK